MARGTRRRGSIHPRRSARRISKADCRTDTINFYPPRVARGADASPSQGQPLFNADPLFLAAYGGNAEVLPDLLKAGASLNGEMRLIGTSNSDAISGAVRHGYLDVADTLVKLGAPVDRTDARITPLVKAVLGDQVDMAKFLIAKGADVNHVEANGMTPLLYAASIDFGCSPTSYMMM